ncbi:hypothetical protein [Sphingomonas cavernae]|uniref:Uncharacterized protein n=1 Tax=Sphingomonas cavernae TaxID=2320861 RepID=A0A418WMB4_9SPHN|nr:hypothetical protein [Sphingomonas cavernae]RJF91149.1 hypothetical protein D3876_13535 [Sphingomonas cavernae]
MEEKKQKRGSTALLVGVCAGAILLVGTLDRIIPKSDERKQYEADQARAELVEQQQRETNTAARRVASLHCASATGEVLPFSRLLKQTMRNPGSFEHVSTKIGPNENGVHAIAMTYRGSNGFGAIDAGVAMGELRNGDCAVKLIAAK